MKVSWSVLQEFCPASEAQNRMLHRLYWFFNYPQMKIFFQKFIVGFYRTFVFRNAQNQILHRISLVFKFPAKNKMTFKIFWSVMQVRIDWCSKFSVEKKNLQSSARSISRKKAQNRILHRICRAFKFPQKKNHWSMKNNDPKSQYVMS